MSKPDDLYHERATAHCLEVNLRLEGDLVYNAFGIAVARFLGGETDRFGKVNLHFQNLLLEKDWENAKVFEKGKHGTNC